MPHQAQKQSKLDQAKGACLKEVALALLQIVASPAPPYLCRMRDEFFLVVLFETVNAACASCCFVSPLHPHPIHSPGLEFPWGPKPFSEVVAGPLLRNNGQTLDSSALEGSHVGVYFSAHWVSVDAWKSSWSELGLPWGSPCRLGRMKTSGQLVLKQLRCSSHSGRSCSIAVACHPQLAFPKWPDFKNG